MNRKIGFLHMPRTGGTYVEALLEAMGPHRFVNFFGTPESQIPNKVGIIERIEDDDGLRANDIRNNPNFNTAEIFSGHFSANIRPILSEYNIEFITILREPISRAASFVKKLNSSHCFREVLGEGSAKIGDDVFWKNFETYLASEKKCLAAHEIHGFSNYMTKAIGGANLNNPNLEVDDDLFEKAKSNLDGMLYVGLFEEYEQSVKDILSLFDLDVYFYVRPREDHVLSGKTRELLEKINQYDIALYNYYLERRKK